MVIMLFMILNGNVTMARVISNSQLEIKELKICLPRTILNNSKSPPIKNPNINNIFIIGSVSISQYLYQSLRLSAYNSETHRS